METYKDDRRWWVSLRLENKDCPYLYLSYPANIHSCDCQGSRDGDYVRCNADDCPYFDEPIY